MHALRGLIRISVARKCLTNQTSRFAPEASNSLFSGHSTPSKNVKKIPASFSCIIKPFSIQNRCIRTSTKDKDNKTSSKEDNSIDTDMLTSLGYDLMAQMRYSEAIEVFERLFAQHKKLTPEALLEIFRTLTNLYGRAGRSDEDSLELLSKLIEIREGYSANDMVHRAREYALEKQYDKEYIYLCKMAAAFAEHMKDPLFEVFYANIEERHEHVIKLVEKLSDAEILPQMWDFLAQAQLILGKPEEALKSIDKALENSQGESWAELRRPFVNTKVQVLIRLGKLEEAMNANEDQDPNYFLTHRSLGQIAYASGEFDDALACYNEAIELHEQIPIDVLRYKSYLLKATALDAKGDLHEAISTYEYVLWIKPDEQISMERLAALYLDIDRIGKAKELLEKLIELRPTDQKLVSKMDYIKARENRANKAQE